MTWKRQLAKLCALLARPKPVDDLESGMPPDEAHYAALRRFGNVALAEERSREMADIAFARDISARRPLHAARAAQDPGFPILELAKLWSTTPASSENTPCKLRSLITGMYMLSSGT